MRDRVLRSRSWVARVGSGEIARFQRCIGLVDHLQLFLRCLVSAMCIGMVELDQFLVACLEANQGEGRLYLEDDEGSLLRRQLPLVAWRLARAVAAGIAKDAEIVAHGGRVVWAVTAAERPGRALPSRVMTDLGFDLGFAHSRVVVPRRIVLADVVEAKPIIKLEARPRTRGAKIAAGGTTGMLANPQLRLRAGRRIDRAFEASAGHAASMRSRAVPDKHRRRIAGTIADIDIGACRHQPRRRHPITTPRKTKGSSPHGPCRRDHPRQAARRAAADPAR